MRNKSKFYDFVSISEKEADLYIFGDITSWEWDETDKSAYSFKNDLEALGDIDILNLHINSYGGEVAEGLAIYNLLKQHKAKVKTFIDGFACSIASVIAMAGDEIIMPKTSLMMIHNCWTYTGGNAKELRKKADDLDKMMKAIINSYMEKVNITEEKLKDLLDNESWLTAEECHKMGFANDIIEDNEDNVVNQHASICINNLVKKARENTMNDLRFKELDLHISTKIEEYVENKEKNKKKDEKEDTSNHKDTNMVSFFDVLSKKY